MSSNLAGGGFWKVLLLGLVEIQYQWILIDFSNINANFSNINEISYGIFKSFDEKIWEKIEKKSSPQLQNQKYFGEMIGLQ